MFQWFLVFKTLWRWRRSVGQIMWEMKTCYRESRKQGISYTQYKRERLYRNCLPKHITEEMMVGKEVTGRWGRRSWQLVDYRMEMRGYWKLKKETLDHALWRTGFGRGCGPAIRQTPEWMNFKQPMTKDNQMRPEVLTMVMMKNTGFWEVPLIFLRNTHTPVCCKISTIQYITHTENGILHLPSDIFQHESHFTAINTSSQGTPYWLPRKPGIPQYSSI